MTLIRTSFPQSTTFNTVTKLRCHFERHVRLFYLRQEQQQYLSTEINNDGYQSIGSFHSDNVEELIRLPNDQYSPPELPFDTSQESPNNMAWMPSTSSAPFANSHRYMKSYPHLDRERWTFLIHGAFRLALDVGLRQAHSWRETLESQPLRYFNQFFLNHMVHGMRCIVDFVTNDEAAAGRIREGTALIQNVTSGMNAVIRGHARCSKQNSLVFFYVSIEIIA